MRLVRVDFRARFALRSSDRSQMDMMADVMADTGNQTTQTREMQSMLLDS